MFIIDFDDTLFDNYAFKHARQRAAADAGVSAEDFLASYRAVSQRGGYSNEAHAAELAGLGYDAGKVLQAFEITTGPALAEWRLPDAVRFLERLAGLGEQLVLFSYGNPAFQELKIIGAGIGTYFDQLVLTPVPKRESITRLPARKGDETAWFINNRVDETIELCQLIPASGVLKRPPEETEEVFKTSGLPYFLTLVEIGEYVATR